MYGLRYSPHGSTDFRAMRASVCRKTPFLEFEPASAVKFDPDLTG